MSLLQEPEEVSTMSKTDKFGCVLTIAAVLCFFGVGVYVGIKYMQSEAVQNGYAEYNSQTGAWQWRNQKAN